MSSAPDPDLGVSPREAWPPAPESMLDALREVRGGGPGAASWELIDAALRRRLLRYFQAHRFGREDAEDLVQNTLARVFQGMAGLRSEESFLAWLFAIARNLRRTAQRRRHRERGLLSDQSEQVEGLPDPRPDAVDERLRGERVAALRSAIERLPPQQRQCVVLRIREEMSYEEIAETLCLSVFTVRNHLAEARRSLRHALSGPQEERR
jgi:RNA polymerase sigma-70 factor, ECF subfamily